MKTIILLVVFLSLAGETFSQDTTKSNLTKEYYLQKSKNQKTTGWVLLASGTTAIVVGVLVMNAGSKEDDFNSGFGDIFGGAIIATVGIVADVVSIPFFISSGKNKRLAASVAFSEQNIYLLDRSVAAAPALSFKIRF